MTEKQVMIGERKKRQKMRRKCKCVVASWPGQWEQQWSSLQFLFSSIGCGRSNKVREEPRGRSDPDQWTRPPNNSISKTAAVKLQSWIYTSMFSLCLNVNALCLQMAQKSVGLCLSLHIISIFSQGLTVHNYSCVTGHVLVITGVATAWLSWAAAEQGSTCETENKAETATWHLFENTLSLVAYSFNLNSGWWGRKMCVSGLFNNSGSVQSITRQGEDDCWINKLTMPMWPEDNEGIFIPQRLNILRKDILI